MKVLSVFALLAAVASAQYGGHGGSHGGYGGGHDGGYGGAPRAYKFEYGVNDPHYGPQFSHSEQGDGKSARGSYSVVLPDGRTQHVKYHADHYGGYNAEVTYSGYAQQPAGYH